MIIVDEMLHDVAKWLRIFGIAVTYVRGLKDEEILKMLKPEDILITADEELASRWNNSILVKDFSSEAEKLAFVLKKLGKKPVLAKTLCPVCGNPLARMSKDQLSEIGVFPPPKVYAAFDEFYYCSHCKKLYWEGSHWRRIRQFAKKVDELLRMI